jgi:glyoxylate/hydroxypyruvate reductase
MRVMICIPRDDADLWTALVREALPEADVQWRDPDAASDPGAPQADYVVLGARSSTLFVEQRRMRAVFTLSAGVRHVLTQPEIDAQVPIVRLEDAGMAAQMTRYVVAAALRFALQLDRYHADQAEARWNRRDPCDVASMTCGVLGLGVIGTRIAHGLLAQGFQVRGHSRTQKAIDGVRCYAGTPGLSGFLNGLDLLVSVLPATDETKNLLQRSALELMAPESHVINIGRGVHLVEQDLLALLDRGHLAGATLDVFREEPLPPEHPFWGRRDITITPHVSGMTLPGPSVAQVTGKIRALERGMAVTGVVDRTRGY